MPQFKIFPSIGIARLGGSSSGYFLCPEDENSLGIELDQNGIESGLTDFKDGQGKIKRQGARFKIYELDQATNQYLPLDTANVIIKWNVHLANKKAAVVRPLDDDGIPNPPDPNHVPTLPLPLKPGSAATTIDGGQKTIEGRNKKNVLIDAGTYTSTVNGNLENVYLGELGTDKAGNLVVLGGRGISRSPSNQQVGPGGGNKTPDASFYFNKDWYDDTSDGPVKATIVLKDGTPIEVSSAWVVIAPPDYAPQVRGVVTLYDTIADVTLGNNLPPQVSFKNDIFPLIARYKSYQWVQVDRNYTLPHPDADVALNDAQHMGQRRDVRDQLLTIKTKLKQFALTARQIAILTKFVNGEFVQDLHTPNGIVTGEIFNRLILDTTVGQGLFPGIEGGRILTNPNIYKEPFRLDENKVDPGDITALMALPWQADFLECVKAWWPSQRPDKVKIADGTVGLWHGPLDPNTDHQKMVKEFDRFGFMKLNPQKTELLEYERDPTFSRV